MNDSNLSLLTQKEVDTLVHFLVDNQSNSIHSSVLNQESIDKLIYLIKNTEINKLNLTSQESTSESVSDNLSKLKIQDTPYELCELIFKINAQTNYLEFYAVNNVTGKTQIITPTIYTKVDLISDDTEWGYCVAPFVLDKIASLFHLKYSRNTYDELYKLYTLKNYGSTDVKLSTIFVPEGTQLLNNLL